LSAAAPPFLQFLSLFINRIEIDKILNNSLCDTVNYAPSYLIKNRYGIFYFQYRIPTKLLEYSKGKKLVRVSLRTRIRRDALNHARMLRIIMDKLTNQFFNSPE
jgi:hypothetical protein